ncbi:MAG: TrmH family RNA methyltransferase, partial [FCB group bacterium]|nr:TrmH family RNA methyltransferase [FCB group bacterium]
MNIKKSSHRDIKSTRPSETSLLSVQRRPIYLVADNIRSLHNIGSIFRTAEAAGIEKLYLTGISGKPPRKEISKTVIGAENNVPWEYHPDILPVFAFFRSQHIPVIALEHTQASTPFQEAEYCFPLCLIVGNEVD